MQMARRVALNGQHLDAVDGRIVISDVEPGDARENISATDTAGGFGQRIENWHRSTLDIIVRFRILQNGRSTAGMQIRSEVLEKVNAWARAGGVLTTNYKPGRRVQVVLAQAPDEGSLWDYSKEFQITFRAYAIPYWEDASQSTQEIGTENEGSASAVIGGSAMTQCDVEVENTSGSTMNEISITVGGKTMAFTGLSLPDGRKLLIDHTEDGLVRIRQRGSVAWASAMVKRTPESANDFTVDPGTAACSYTADQACTVTVKWRNRYL